MPLKPNTPQDKNIKSIFGGSSEPEHRIYPVGLVHNFYIFDEIQDPADYVDFITALDTASENDLINVYLNTPGGNLMTAISIIHAIKRSDATVIAHADGEVASAGSLIFFACPNKVIMPYAHLMLHDASMFSGGKLSESIKGITAMADLVFKIAHDTYYPYFSEQEIGEILDGRDFYCSAEDVYARLEQGEKVLKQLEEQEVKELQNKTKKKPKK